jgi:hypothetical protein
LIVSFCIFDLCVTRGIRRSPFSPPNPPSLALPKQLREGEGGLEGLFDFDKSPLGDLVVSEIREIISTYPEFHRGNKYIIYAFTGNRSGKLFG